MSKRYIIGIDLGTTNSAVSYVDMESEDRKIRIFRIPQLTGAGEIAAIPLLPSFLYLAGNYDISKEGICLPWDKSRHDTELTVVGTYARDHGTKVPSRLVSSAKSWLCHSGVDRRAKILPWGGGSEIPKISPVQASAAYLSHIKNAWNRDKGDDEDRYLEHQMIVLTVPASFDEVARDLTIEAAAAAGLNQVTLLEEPLAAFYSWLSRHESNWYEFVKPGELILVCDVGGGTTDFTLISLKEAEGSPRFERIAVGDHLILGGDNMDLALARRMETRFKTSRSKAHSALTPDRWKTLCHQCRQAKEIILNGDADSKKITLMGTGSKLIADTLSTELRRDEIEAIILEGFFPITDPQTPIKPSARKGITEFGLPYEPEPAITRHLSGFLQRHKPSVAEVLQRDNSDPDLILFNGGALKPMVIQERIRSAIQRWSESGNSENPRVLENPDPDLAVALGASYYGLVKAGHGIRVGSGSPRSYYLGVEAAERGRQKTEGKLAMCIVERGLEEGSVIELTDRRFEVLTNQPAAFDLYSSSFRSGDQHGDLIEIDDSLTRLPPLRTVIQFGKKGEHSRIPVHLEAGYTEVGTLSIRCRSEVSNHHWQLRFQLRESRHAGPMTISDQEVFEASVVEAVRQLVQTAFSGQTNFSGLPSLMKNISDLIQRSKEKWPLGLVRTISDELIERIAVRAVRNEVESRWLNLTGFCLRPGFGDGFDEHRIKTIWKIYKSGPIFSNNPQVRSEWWIFWRRVAGGLTAGQQRQIFQDLMPTIMPKKGTKLKISAQEYIEIWMALANMERLSIKDKIRLGQQMLSEINPKRFTPQQFWAISRIGARELLYGTADRVIPPSEVSEWIETLLKESWPHPKPVGIALAQLARKTGDRVRDIDPSLANRLIQWLSQYEGFNSQIQLIQEVVPVARQEEQTIFGESLPSGLICH